MKAVFEKNYSSMMRMSMDMCMCRCACFSESMLSSVFAGL